jgi:hypothetical protein
MNSAVYWTVYSPTYVRLKIVSVMERMIVFSAMHSTPRNYWRKRNSVNFRTYCEAIGAVVLAAFIAMFAVWTKAATDFGGVFFGICIFFLIACACRVDWIALYRKLDGDTTD